MKFVINIISDTSGHATKHLVNKSLLQFDIDYNIKVYPGVNNIDLLDSILNQILLENNDNILYYSVQDSKMNAHINNFCKSHHISSVDVIGFSIQNISKAFKLNPSKDYKQKKLIESEFYKKINALDFSIKYDDGKDLESLQSCDIALIGVSRSSKTPLSMYLASKGFRVSNVPILLGNQAARQLYEIDTNKIFGLTIDKDLLKKYRIERLKAMGLPTSSSYSDIERIEEELTYSIEIMQDLGCTIIDMSHKSIEEASELIITKIENLRRENNFD